MPNARNEFQRVPTKLKTVKGRTYPKEFKNCVDVVRFWYVGRKLLKASKSFLSKIDFQDGMHDFHQYIRQNIQRHWPALSRRNGIIHAINHGLSITIHQQGLQLHNNLCRFRVTKKVKKPKAVVPEKSDGIDMGPTPPPPPGDGGGGGDGGPPDETSRSAADIEAPRQRSPERSATHDHFDFSFRLTNNGQNLQIPDPDVQPARTPGPIPQLPAPGSVPGEQTGPEPPDSPGPLPPDAPGPLPPVAPGPLPPVAPGPLTPVGRPTRRRPPAQPAADQEPQRIHPRRDRNPFMVRRQYGRRRFQPPIQAPIQIPPVEPPRIEELGQLRDRVPFYGQLHQRTTELLRAPNTTRQQLLANYDDEETEDDMDFEDIERLRRSVSGTVPTPAHSTPRPGAVVPPPQDMDIDPVLPDEPPIVPETSDVVQPVQPSTGVQDPAIAETQPAPHPELDEHVPTPEPRQEPKDSRKQLLAMLKEDAKNYSGRYKFSDAARTDNTSKCDAAIMFFTFLQMNKDKLIELKQDEPYGDIFIDFIE